MLFKRKMVAPMLRTAACREARTGRRKSERGAVQVEFALVAVTFFLVMFGIVEMERMLLVYNTLANATKAGARYAMVHGHDRHSSGAVGPSSSPAEGGHANVDNVVIALAKAGTLNSAKLTVTVTYDRSNCSVCSHDNDPGSKVTVSAVYAYDPFTVLPVSVNLTSGSQGIITF